MWRAYTGVIHCVFDQIPNLQIALPPQTKLRGREGLRHPPQSPFTGNFLKKRRHLGIGVFIDIWSLGGGGGNRGLAIMHNKKGKFPPI